MHGDFYIWSVWRRPQKKENFILLLYISLFAYGIPVLLGAFLLKISVKKSLIYMVIGVTLLLLSELVIVQVGGLFSKASDLSDKVVLPIINSTDGKNIYIT